MALRSQIRGIVGALRQASPVEAVSQATPSQARPAVADGKRSVHRILLADPHSVTRNVANCILTNLGYAVDQVSDGPSALVAIESEHYDLVLVDVSLPEVDGYSVSRAVRNSERNATVPVIALITGDARTGRGDREAAGINDYLSKPLRAPLVESVLSRWDAEASTAPPPSAIDTGMLDSLRDMAGERGSLLLQELVELFQGTVPARLVEIRQALTAGDFAAISFAAHALRGPASQLGANEMAQTCASIETLAQARSAGLIAEALIRLDHDFSRSVAALKAYCRETQANRAPGPKLAPPSRRAAEPAAQESKPSGARPVILLAEDDPLVARFVTTQLDAVGYEVVLAKDGAQALHLISSRKFDAAILDVNMPGADGFGVLSEIKLREETKSTPVLMLTGRSQGHDIVRAFDLGASDYVTKPFNPLDLVARVKRLSKS